MLPNKSTIVCAVGGKGCLREFECEHVWCKSIDGHALKVPHCFKCFFDALQCPDKHGYQCSPCATQFPEFTPKTYEPL